MGYSQTQVSFERQAAEVITYVIEVATGSFDGPPEAQMAYLDKLFDVGMAKWRCFAEIHAARQWVWPALGGGDAGEGMDRRADPGAPEARVALVGLTGLPRHHTLEHSRVGWNR
jgi:hypothetical protein